MRTLRLALRKWRRQGLYTAINVTGLAIGLASFILIMLYVREERSFDRFHEKSNRIYRLTSTTSTESRAFVPYKWGETLQYEWAEVETLASIQNITIALTVRKGEEIFAQHGFVGADSTFFNLFDFPVLKGDRGKFLRTPDKMVITPEMAGKYFKGEDPIGRTLEVNLWGTYVTFEVEGVVQCPENSHLQFGFLIPIEPVKKHSFNPTAFESWTTHFAYTYLELANPHVYQSDREKIRRELKNFLERHGGKELSDRCTADLEPLEDIYLKSDLQFDFPPRGNILHLRILSAVAFGILLMAIINYTNLTTAQTLRNLKEITLKRILGSGKGALIRQFLGESVILSLLSLAIVGISISLLVPYYNDLTGKTFRLTAVFTYSNFFLLGVATLATGVFSGLYPALLFSSFEPAGLARTRPAGKLNAGKARKILVVAQFALTVVLLISTGVVYEQIRYMQGKDLGFDRDQVIVMNDARIVAADPLKTRLLREELTKYEGIRSVSASSSHPGQQTWSNRYVPEGFAEEESVSIFTIYADHDFVPTYDLDVLQGRNFDRNFKSDSSAFLVNEAAVRLFSSRDSSWSVDPLNKKLYFTRDETEGQVIGVVNDFHLESPKQEIAPLVIYIEPRNFFTVQIKLDTRNLPQTLEVIESTWKKLFPDIPFTYSFVDQEFAAQFTSDQKLGEILRVFAVLFLVVAILGLFGLASFLAFEKAREMCIRKVIGATEKQLLASLSWLFLKLILLSNLAAMPLGFLLMRKWLEGFAYRIGMPYHVFFIAAGISILATLLAIGYHAWKTARINPAQILARE